MPNITIREFLNNYKKGNYNGDDVETQIDAGWHDWFCDESKLRDKTIKLVKYLKSIVRSQRINIDTMYVFFKNNCPCNGKLYDDFRICDIKTKDVIYTVTPHCGHWQTEGQSIVLGRENDFKEPLVTGTWEDVQQFFEVTVSLHCHHKPIE
jgi:hypothetical protein